MSTHIRKALQMMEAAKPASGFRPETPMEWRKLQQAQEEMGYAMFREAGMPHSAAKELAHQIYGGLAGMILLDLAFRDDDDEQP
jgi:hypothetical protein